MERTVAAISVAHAGFDVGSCDGQSPGRQAGVQAVQWGPLESVFLPW